MVVTTDDGGAAEGADHRTEDPGRPEARPGPGRGGGGTRRGVLRGLLASAATAALTPLVTASSRPASRASGRPGHPGPVADTARTREITSPHDRVPVPCADAARRVRDLVFDETYRGRRIRGFRTSGGRGADAAAWYVTVDGGPLHMMRRADGTWMTVVDHYRSYATPLEAARGAVDEMAPGTRLRDTGHGPRHEEGRHGVHP